MTHKREFLDYLTDIQDATQHISQFITGMTWAQFSQDQKTICTPKLIGMASSKRLPLFNGALECRLYEFLIVQGGARRRLVPPTQA